MHYVYSLKCKNGYYVGCTNNLKDRINRHTNGHINTTKNRLPMTLEFYIALKNEKIAFTFEQYLKSGSGRAFTNRHLSTAK